ncbi:hypothetical protein [Mesorhizobium sp. ESP-6-2]|uniref:hypothetical protein n=1 Tax=Mesorhizobium sp. ESP-6-2 TaxID=2876625 RepID=UPI001CC993AD|nr:hypothetical protein [Mesorhizobium sp. ESP-6-2]MBZ9807666.1 hypothetical protein [Mesorhizobium sp. ESP-6-2]
MAEPTGNFEHGNRIVNGCNKARSLAASVQHLSQISDERSCSAIGQNQTPDNAAFGIGGIRSGDVHPRDDSDLAIDAVNFSALGKNVRDYHRLGKRRVRIVLSHHNLSATTRGESDAKSAHRVYVYSNLIVGAGLERREEHQPHRRNTTDNAPAESAADEISALFHCDDNLTTEILKTAALGLLFLYVVFGVLP